MLKLSNATLFLQIGCNFWAYKQLPSLLECSIAMLIFYELYKY